LRRKRGTALRVIKRALKEAQNRADGTARGMAGLVNTIIDFEEPAAGASADETEIRGAIKDALDAAPGRKIEIAAMLKPHQPPAAAGVGAAANNEKPSSNELALALLTAKAEHVTYCEPRHQEPLTISGVPRLRAYVLGPPRDETCSRKICRLR
jgi:hypothetical protein